MMDFAKNLDQIISRIEKARLAYSRHHIVQLIAVSKYASTKQIATLYACGQRAFGENKIQDLQAKSEHLADLPLEWHMLGSLQSNKINKMLALKPFLFHSLHSLALAQEIQARSPYKLKALLQVNVSLEKSKSGVRPECALETYQQIKQTCPQIELQGIMAIGPQTEDTRQIERAFQSAKDIFDKLPQASILSMGMSGDFEIAISYGANMVRIGQALFKEPN
ncbi:YggS family pyridoxal phosphate-dependent enzyme [Helicobacter bizzozeronii]|uniref:YggS family pyridoxal phosphate-dependent enzyme n=1 Tax=Helicobacter bizzozeronii TaxID=56877 RepID=UPI0018F83B7D|nr:YggS family pyridoxal phosphate-dependent enzyme [Helicobacter bizzozeronii]